MEPPNNRGSKPESAVKRAAEKLQHDAEEVDLALPSWLRPDGPESRFPVAIAILAAIAMQYAIPDKYGLHPRWLIPTLEVALLAILVVVNPVRLARSTTLGRYASYLLVAAITLDNTFSAVYLDHAIITRLVGDDALGLLASGAAIYLTNIIAFGILYWELDRGGPFARIEGRHRYPDFLFPQMANPELTQPNWAPTFVDYLYVSLTNVVAFSPTDTMPLSRWAKTAMSAQSLVALSTTALVIARAVNILH